MQLILQEKKPRYTKTKKRESAYSEIDALRGYHWA